MRRQIRYTHQLLLSYLLIILVALGTFSLLTSRSIKRFHLQQNIAALKTEALIAGQQITPLLAPPLHGAMDQLCKQLGRDITTRITVILPDGGQWWAILWRHPAVWIIIVTGRKLPPPLPAKPNQQSVTAKPFGQRMLYVAVPMGDRQTPDAIVRVALPLTALDHEISIVNWQLVASGIIVALLATLLGFFVSKRILRPLEAMRQGAQRFSAGELNHRMSGYNIHELNSLATDMNQMAQQLKQRIDTISQQKYRYEAVVSSMDEGVVAVDMEGQILSINQVEGVNAGATTGQCSRALIAGGFT